MHVAQFCRNGVAGLELGTVQVVKNPSGAGGYGVEVLESIHVGAPWEHRREIAWVSKCSSPAWSEELALEYARRLVEKMRRDKELDTHPKRVLVCRIPLEEAV